MKALVLVLVFLTFGCRHATVPIDPPFRNAKVVITELGPWYDTRNPHTPIYCSDWYMQPVGNLGDGINHCNVYTVCPQDGRTCYQQCRKYECRAVFYAEYPRAGKATQ